MSLPTTRRRSRYAVALAAIGLITIGVATQRVRASDHQDTPEVELNPRMDINDVYAFPGSSADRIALIMTTSSPIAGQSASFDPNLLYQLKVDNSGDAVEDLVFQVTFDEGTGANQKFTIRGPVAPGMTGTKATLVSTGTVTTGNVGSIAGSATGIQAFAGIKADPFVLDLEPDRRPERVI